VQPTAMRAIATATATTWAMATATRLVGNKEGNAKGGKGYGDRDKGGGQQEGEGGKAMAPVTSVVGKWMATATKGNDNKEEGGRGGKGQWQGWQMQWQWQRRG
jgi:hypothetical protein